MRAPSTSLDLQEFFNTRRNRVALARQRYFEEGLLPSGIVSDAVYESWARCQRLHAWRAAKVTFEPVSPSRAHRALQRNHDLVQAWQQELPRLQTVLGTTSCAAMLTDATGILVGATCVGRAHEDIMPVATRTGVNLCEEAVGTTAPGVAARTGKAVSVDGAEHYFDAVQTMHCSAVPIHNAQGQLAGVLDVSSESIPFSFDAGAVVGAFAAAIENRLCIAESSEHLVIRFQLDRGLLDSNFVAMAGIDRSGCVAWRNEAASRLLGPRPAGRPARAASAEAAFGTSLSILASLPRSGAVSLYLANGLMVWARCEMRAPDGRRDLVTSSKEIAHRLDKSSPSGFTRGLDACSLTTGAQAVSSPIVSTASEPRSAETSIRLKDQGKDLIERTLGSCGGNVSKTAELLVVSRGLIYRRLSGPKRSAR